MASGALEFFASLTTTKFKSGAKELADVSRQASEGVAANFKKIAFAIAGIGAAFLGIRSAVQSFNSAIAYGGALSDLSARTGETAGNLAILQRAFENAGAGAESVGPVINRLQRAIVEASEKGGEAAKTFEKLKINLSDLRGRTPTEQLRMIGDAIARLPEGDRAAAAMQLLGRSGGELIPLFRALGVEFENAKQQLGSVPRIIDQTAGHLDAIGDSINAISQKGRDFMLGVLSKIAPALAQITDQIARIDAAKLGEIVSGYVQRFAEFLSQVFQVRDGLERIKLAIEEIGKGNTGEGLELLFKSVRNWGMNAINEILAAAQAGIATIWQTLSSLFRANGPMAEMLTALFGFISNKLRQAVNEAVSELPRVLGGGAQAKERAAIYGGAADVRFNTMQQLAGMAGQDLMTEAGQLRQRFESNFANASRPFDMSSREAEVQAITDRMLAPTVDQARRLMQDLQVLQAREPDSADRRAKENEIINAIKEMRSNGLSSGAVNRMAEEASRFAAPNGSPQAGTASQEQAKNTASESTLQKAVAFLEQLNTKLPQPVLV